MNYYKLYSIGISSKLTEAQLLYTESTFSTPSPTFYEILGADAGVLIRPNDFVIASVRTCVRAVRIERRNLCVMTREPGKERKGARTQWAVRRACVIVIRIMKRDSEVAIISLPSAVRVAPSIMDQFRIVLPERVAPNLPTFPRNQLSKVKILDVRFCGSEFKERYNTMKATKIQETNPRSIELTNPSTSRMIHSAKSISQQTGHS